MSEGKPIYAALMAVQSELKAPKNQRNSFGKYNYRSAEDIIEAVKPLLKDNGLFLNMSDDVVLIGERYYIRATVKVVDIVTGESVSASAMAREAAVKKGMDDSQVTGTASSYARKYALNGLFAIDDNKDPDTNEYRQQTTQARQAAQTVQNYTQSMASGATDAELRRKAMHSLNEAIRRTGASKEEVAAICGVKYHKTSCNELTNGQISTLAAHLEEYIAEAMGGK